MRPASAPTVLIVDDDRVTRTLLAELLRDECRVLLARDGPSALERIRDEPIDLVLLDVAMPQMSGYEVLQRMQAMEHAADTLVVFVTASHDARGEEYGLSLGAIDYIAKPVRSAIVLSRIRNYLRLIAQRKELERTAERDFLTGIPNRRYFDRSFALAWRHAVRTGRPVSLAMIDVDHFKAYNDRHGHGAGDEALCLIAGTLAGAARRSYDIAARYGGEEFALLLPDTAEPGPLLDQLRHDVAALGLAYDASRPDVVLTVSIGAITVHAHPELAPEELLRLADALLYDAKREGRDRVRLRSSIG